ncbi:predicted protein [Uncinocarpus reesii 1704]|uniref:Uncharacterized protein n=1 Tax=Uncinocarpus reesii (strain UAMH 1704) TaxID=336963 RepID=C4JSU1_UNCRE|nr:uncharacterized protein UREG_05530 [Uncinocarpus reesii 1704]EEP80688.1 predicted protein [Uncinocarpus reesii 1704]
MKILLLGIWMFEGPPAPTPFQIEGMTRHLIAESTNISADTEGRLFGNQAGMSLLKEIEQLHRRIDHLKNEVHPTLYLAHSTTLDDWSNQQDQGRILRQGVVHGGNVLVDVAVIRQYGHSPRTVKWTQAFYHRYGVAFRFADQILSAPSKFVTALNWRASVQSLWVWGEQQNLARASTVIEQVDKLIEIWKAGSEVLFHPTTESQRLFDATEIEWQAV